MLHGFQILGEHAVYPGHPITLALLVVNNFAVWKVKDHLRKIHKIDDVDVIEAGFAKPKYGFIRRIREDA